MHSFVCVRVDAFVRVCEHLRADAGVCARLRVVVWVCVHLQICVRARKVSMHAYARPCVYGRVSGVWLLLVRNKARL